MVFSKHQFWNLISIFEILDEIHQEPGPFYFWNIENLAAPQLLSRFFFLEGLVESNPRTTMMFVKSRNKIIIIENYTEINPLLLFLIGRLVNASN